MREDENNGRYVKLFVLNPSDCCYQPKGRDPWGDPTNVGKRA